MQVQYTLTGSVNVPNGSSINEGSTSIVLPSGDQINFYPAAEISNPTVEDVLDPLDSLANIRELEFGEDDEEIGFTWDEEYDSQVEVIFDAEDVTDPMVF